MSTSKVSVLSGRCRLLTMLGFGVITIGVVTSGGGAGAAYAPQSSAQSSLVSVNATPIGPYGGGNLLTVAGTEADAGSNGSGHSHVTVLAVDGNEIYGLDSGGSTGDALSPLEDAALSNPTCIDGSGGVCVAVLPMTAVPGNASFSIATASYDSGAYWVDLGNSASSLYNSPPPGCQGGYTSSQLLAGNSPTDYVLLVGSGSSAQKCGGGAPGTVGKPVLNITGSYGEVLRGTGVPSAATGCATPSPLPTMEGVGVSTCNSSDQTATTSGSALLVLLPVGDVALASSSASAPSIDS
jgi:hypothetical protein